MTGRFPRRHPIAAGVTSALVVLAAGGGLWLGLRPSSNSAAAAFPLTTTTTSTVSRSSIRETVSATGTLAPAHDDSLNFEVSGRVKSVRVSVGDHVRKGEVLATVDSASLHASVASARAAVASDAARVSDDEDDDATSTQTNADRSALAAARNQLASAKRQLDDAELTSPITGVVVARDLTRGESVSGSSTDSSGASTALTAAAGSTSSSAQLEVMSTKSWIVNATVDASSVGSIAKGDQAQLTVDGVSATVYGTVKSVGLVPSSSDESSTSTTYPVVINVTGSPKGLLDGESVTADVIYKQLSGVLVVPTDAVHTTSSGGSYVVTVDSSGGTTNTTVKTGISSGGETQIVSGVTAGDKVQVQQFRPGTSSTSGSGSGSTEGGFSRSGFGGFGGSGFPGGTTGGFPGGFGGGTP